MSIGHWPSIVVAALAAFGIGAVWYSPVAFAQAWARANGYGPEKVQAMQATAGRTYTVSFFCFVLMAWVLHIMLSHLGAETAGRGAASAFHAWLGIAMPIGLTANLYSDKPLAAFFIDTGYQLVYLLAMGAILGAWH